MFAAVVFAAVAGLGEAGQGRARDAGLGGRSLRVAGGGVVSGIVRTVGGRRLRDALVTLERGASGTGLRRSTVTEESGHYRFDEVPTGQYRLFAVKAGFGARYYGGGERGDLGAAIEVRGREVVDDVDVVLARGAVVTGRVLDTAGLPIAGASVVVARRVREEEAVNLHVAGRDQTDDRGTYRVFDLEPGVYYVRGIAATEGISMDGRDSRGWRNNDVRVSEGYAPTYYPGVRSWARARTVALRESQTVSGIDFALVRVGLASVSGSVTAVAGANPAGTSLQLARVGGAELAGDVFAAWALPGGAFAFDRVYLGRYVLRAAGRTTSGGAAFARMVIDVEGRGVEGVSVALAPGVSVSGVVQFEGAEPTWRDIVDLQVSTRLEEAIGGSAEVRAAIEEGTGSFYLRDLRPGSRRFEVTGLGEDRVLDRIVFNGRDITERAVTLGGGVRVTGLEIIVTDRVSQLRGMVRGGRDAPGRGAVVVVFSTDPGRWFPGSRYVLTERPGQDGRYRIRGMPPGDYWVTAEPLSAINGEEWLARRSLGRLRTGAMRVGVRKGEAVELDVQVRRW